MTATETSSPAAEAPPQPGNTYSYSQSDITPANEPLYTSPDSQTCDRDAANDVEGNDSLHRDLGDDILEGGAGDDTLVGGAGGAAGDPARG